MTVVASGTVERPLLEHIPWCGAWALTTYSKCEFRCVYCSTGVQGVSTPRFSPVETRARLRAELAAHPGVRIGVGALCDAYPDVEREHRVTRAAVELLVEEGRSFGITTKGTTLLRDVDLLQQSPDARVTVSLCGTDDALVRRVDSRAPAVAARLALVRVLVDAGITVHVSVAPWIPGVTDAEALIRAVGDDVTVWFTVLDVSTERVAATRFGRRFDQAAVVAAYLRERDRVGPRPNVVWSEPTPGAA